MSAFVAIDPGRKALGWAYFNDRHELVAAGIVRGRAGESTVEISQRAAATILAKASAPLHVVYERMQVYNVQQQRGAQADLVELAEIGGGVAALLASSSTPVLPREWKGTVPKDVLAARVRKDLSAQDLAVAVAAEEQYPSSLRHNLWDAIGIGRWWRLSLDHYAGSR